MTRNRIIDVAETSAHLHLQFDNLVLDLATGEQARVPLEDIAAVSVSHPSASISKSAMAGLAGQGVALVVCDEHHLPVGMLLPLGAHYAQTERFAAQAAAAPPTKKRLWQQVVRAKIRAQGRLLERLRGDDAGLNSLAGQVRSGDSTNIEATAARQYWTLLVGDQDFYRDRYGPWPNPLLNYGYAILRALVARAVCTSGLHPSLGLHHHNRYDPFCLADDLMEPLRPVVDRVVMERLGALAGIPGELGRADKQAILETLYGRFAAEDGSRTIFDLISRMTSSLADVFAGGAKTLYVPVV